MIKPLPLFLTGKVCKGFSRGSKELGIPTANMDENVVESLPTDIVNGVYFGWAQVDDSPVYPAALNIGWNPFYKNEKKSVEVHLIHTFDEDFYESQLKVVVLGYIRPEKNFSCKEDLIDAIRNDIIYSVEILQNAYNAIYQNHEFFRNSQNSNSQQSQIDSDSKRNNSISAKV